MNVIHRLKSALQLAGPKQFPFQTAGRVRYLKYIEQSRLLEKFKLFYGDEVSEEIKSITKHLLKGKISELPLTMLTVSKWKLPVIKKFVKDCG